VSISAETVRFDGGRMWIGLSDGRVIGVPLAIAAGSGARRRKEWWVDDPPYLLRVFLLAVQSKEILTDRDYDWRGRLLKRRR
jgi:hypothetical protein